MKSDGGFSATDEDQIHVTRDMVINGTRCTLIVTAHDATVDLSFDAVNDDGATVGSLNGSIARDDLIAISKALNSTLAGVAIALGQTQPSYNANVEEIRKVYPQAYAPWTADDDERLIQRYHEGASVSQLCYEFGRNPGGITSRLKVHRLVPDAQQGRQGGPNSDNVDFDFDGSDLP